MYLKFNLGTYLSIILLWPLINYSFFWIIIFNRKLCLLLFLGSKLRKNGNIINKRKKLVLMILNMLNFKKIA